MGPPLLHGPKNGIRSSADADHDELQGLLSKMVPLT